MNFGFQEINRTTAAVNRLEDLKESYLSMCQTFFNLNKFVIKLLVSSLMFGCSYFSRYQNFIKGGAKNLKVKPN